MEFRFRDDTIDGVHPLSCCNATWSGERIIFEGFKTMNPDGVNKPGLLHRSVSMIACIIIARYVVKYMTQEPPLPPQPQPDYEFISQQAEKFEIKSDGRSVENHKIESDEN